MAEHRYFSMMTSMNGQDVRNIWHLICNAQHERAYREISDTYSRCCHNTETPIMAKSILGEATSISGIHTALKLLAK